MWTLELFRTVDGLRLGELPPVSFSWSRTVRDGKMDAPPQGAGQQTLSSFSFPIHALEGAGWIDRSERHWQQRLLAMFTPRRCGVMALYDGVPIVGGPLAHQVDIDAEKVSVTVDGFVSLLADRYVVPEDFGSDRQIAYRGISLGTIAKRVVQVAMEKPGGMLPITFSPDEKADRERTYQAFNVANLSVADVLEKLSNVINGPDIDLRPYVLDGQHFAWHLHTGTEADPWIGQDTIHDWEVGSADVMELTGRYSTAFIAHRVYGVGGDQDVATVTTRVGVGDTPGVYLPQDFPLVERVFSDSSELDAGKLAAYAAARLNEFPMVQPSMTVRADGTNRLGDFWPGEIAQVTVSGSPIFHDGTYRWRILGLDGDSGKTVRVTFDPVEVTEW